jgi:hypothetical protein
MVVTNGKPRAASISRSRSSSGSGLALGLGLLAGCGPGGTGFVVTYRHQQTSHHPLAGGHGSQTDHLTIRSPGVIQGPGCQGRLTPEEHRAFAQLLRDTRVLTLQVTPDPRCRPPEANYSWQGTWTFVVDGRRRRFTTGWCVGHPALARLQQAMNALRPRCRARPR